MTTVNLLTKLSMATAGAAVMALGMVGNAQAATFYPNDSGFSIQQSYIDDGGSSLFQWGGGLFSASAFLLPNSVYSYLAVVSAAQDNPLLSNTLTNASQISIQAEDLPAGEYILDFAAFSEPFREELPPPVEEVLPPQTSVPEPASLIGILGLGAFGITSLRKRKQAKADKV